MVLKMLMDVSLQPNPSGLPGFSVLTKTTNAVAAFGLVACLLAAIGGAVGWAAGAGSSNAAIAAMGKKTVAGAIVGAVIVGGAAAIVNFAYHAGQQIQ